MVRFLQFNYLYCWCYPVLIAPSSRQAVICMHKILFSRELKLRTAILRLLWWNPTAVSTAVIIYLVDKTSQPARVAVGWINEIEFVLLEGQVFLWIKPVNTLASCLGRWRLVTWVIKQGIGWARRCMIGDILIKIRVCRPLFFSTN